jgi:hypothetical protein
VSPEESANYRNGGKGGEEKGEERPVRLFHDDTFKGFFRRLAWSIDGTRYFFVSLQAFRIRDILRRIWILGSVN